MTSNLTELSTNCCDSAVGGMSVKNGSVPVVVRTGLSNGTALSERSPSGEIFLKENHCLDKESDWVDGSG